MVFGKFSNEIMTAEASAALSMPLFKKNLIYLLNYILFDRPSISINKIVN